MDLPYSYLATRKLINFTTVVDEMMRRIQHSHGEQYYRHIKSVPADLADENPFEKKRLKLKKCISSEEVAIDEKSHAVSNFIAHEDNSLSQLYSDIVQHGAANTYQNCLAEIDPYLWLVDEHYHEQESAHFALMAKHNCYKDGQIDTEEFLESKGIPVSMKDVAFWQGNRNEKAKQMREREEFLTTFPVMLENATLIAGLHLYPELAKSKSYMKKLSDKMLVPDTIGSTDYITSLKEKMLVIDMTTNHICTDNKQQKPSLDTGIEQTGRQILLDKLSFVRFPSLRDVLKGP